MRYAHDTDEAERRLDVREDKTICAGNARATNLTPVRKQAWINRGIAVESVGAVTINEVRLLKR